MPAKGELVQFKEGTHGIQSPNNFGIYAGSRKTKKGVLAKVVTIHGLREMKSSSLYKRSFGEKVQLVNNRLPAEKELKERLRNWIKNLNRLESRESKAVAMGELNEKGLWQKAVDKGTELTELQLAQIWYEEEDVSRNRTRKVSEVLKKSSSLGVGFFSPLSRKDKLWRLLSREEYKDINRAISDLGRIRGKMFEMVEEPSEEDPEEIVQVRRPVIWDEIDFTEDERVIFDRLRDIMVHYIEFDRWPDGDLLGGTYVHTIDGFSLQSYLTYLAEDWVDEGRTSRADVFLKLLSRTGYMGDDEALVLLAKRAINLAKDFSWETPEEIEQLAAKYREPKETPGAFDGRLDLRDLEAYTIDPPTAKDFDDAITVIEHDNGYTLWVHIADVANYVEHHTALDLHAQRRATSVYLPVKVLPMLPSHLSDNLCSLNAKRPRLAMSVRIEYDREGRKVPGSEEVHNTVIEVRENLSYGFVNDQIREEKEPFVTYHRLAQLINRHRRSLNLETPEVRLELGAEMTITTKTATDSTKLIETFMVAANEAIGEIFHRAGVPGIYRCHPTPDEDKVEKFNGQMKVLELPLQVELPEVFEQEEKEEESLLSKLKAGGGNISFSFGGGGSLGDFIKDQIGTEEEEEVDLGTPLVKGIAQLDENAQNELLKPFIDTLKFVEGIEDDTELQRLAYLTVLKMFPLAFYTAANIGHFGLGSVRYVHFTSPIRRYPDVVAHRICKRLIAEGRPGGTGEGSGELVYTADEIEEISEHSSDQGVLASRLERQIVSAGFTFLAKNQSFEQRQGIVSSINSGGVFVLLPNGIEARVPLSQMTTKPTFVDDTESMCFIGSRGRFDMQEEINPDNYKELLGADNEIAQVLVKIGDKMAIEFTKLDHVEGNISARPVKIFPRIPGGYGEGQDIILEEEE